MGSPSPLQNAPLLDPVKASSISYRLDGMPPADRAAAVAAAGILIAAACAAGLNTAAVLHPSAIPPLFLAIVLIAAGYAAVDYEMTAGAFRAMTRGIAITGGLFVLVHPPSYDVSETASPAMWHAFFAIGYYAAVAGAVLALARPLFILVPASYLQLHTVASNVITSAYSSDLDYIPVAQAGVFLAAGLMTTLALARLPALRRDRATLVPTASGLLAAAAIGLHFANYFHSGIAKLSLDGGVTSWLLENDVGNRYLAALDNGVLPFAGWPEFTAWLYEQLHAHHLAGNFAVVAVQLAVLLAVASPRGILVFSLAADLLHVGIYLTSGANFWPWFGLNLTTACAAAHFRAQGFTAAHRAIAMAMVALAPPFFYVAKLAWYDTPANNRIRFVAELDDGQLQDLPFAYFRSKSYPVAYMSLGTPLGHYPTTTLAGTQFAAVAREAKQCSERLRALHGPREHPIEDVDTFVRRHHRYVLGNPAPNPLALGGLLDHFASHGASRTMLPADPRRIVAYRYIVESICLGYSDGKFTRRIDHVSERRIDVGR